MSLSNRKRHGLSLILAAIAVATIAACDSSSPTQPSLQPTAQQLARIEGDTSQCTRGWIIISGAYQCL